MKDIKIYVSKETRKVDIERSVIGNDAENLQGNLVFSFCDDFVNGTARIEYTINGESHYQMLEKQDEKYIIPIKSVLTKKGQIDMQLVITEQGEYQLTNDTKYKENKLYFVKEGNEYIQLTEGTDYEIDDDIIGEVYEMVNIPIFKSNIFYLVVNKSINAEGGEAPEEYASWLEIANQKLIEIDNLDLDVERAEDGVIVVITKKDGSVKYAEVYDGQGGGTSASINGVELNGNKTSADLKICDMPQGYDLPTGQFDGQLFYLIPRQSEAQDTRGLYKFNGSSWHKIGDLSAGILEINAETHTTIRDYDVPVLTDEQIADAYLGFKAGKIVLIIDDMETRAFKVIQARQIENTETAITIMYDDKLILTYQIGRDIVFNDIEMKNAYESIRQIGEINRYLFETNYGYLDYEKAKKHYNELYEINPYACSTIVKGNVIGRNFDYTYDEQAEFVVRTGSYNNRYASIGIAGQVGLNREFVQSGEYSDKYEILPFNMQDGINEKGLFASIHIVPQDNGITTGTIVQAREEIVERINALMLVRYVLDNFATVDEVINATEDYLSIYVPQALREKGYEVHFLFSDNNKTYVLEFINNVCEWTDISDYPVLTNFFINGVLFPQNHKLPEIGNSDILGTELTPRSMGIERYNDLIDGLTSNDSIKDILESVKYTNTYNDWGNEAWASEYCGTNGLEVTMTRDSFIDTYLNGRDEYLIRTRENPITSQTIHSSIYDKTNNKLIVYTQENYGLTDDFMFNLPQTESGSASINGVLLEGNKTSSDLGLQDEITSQTTLSLNKAIFGNMYVDESTLIASGQAMENLQTSKVNKSDIVDNLISMDTDKPLSANMGKELKYEIDTIDAKIGSIDTALQTINNGGGVE